MTVNLTLDDLIYKHNECLDYWLKNSDDFILHNNINLLLEDISNKSLFITNTNNRKLLKSIYDKWNYTFLAKNISFPNIVFHDSITYTHSHDVKFLKQQAMLYILKVIFNDPNIKLQSPEDDLIWMKF